MTAPEPSLTTITGGSRLDLTISVRRAELRFLAVPSAPVIAALGRDLSHVHMVLVRVEDDDGVTGTSCLWSLEQAETDLLAAAVRFLAPLVTTAPPLRIAEFYGLMLKHINFLGLKGVTVFGLSAFDVAFYDLVCRRLSTSLGRLLGGDRTWDSVSSYWSGLYVGAGRDELEREVAEQLERGFRSFKMRVGHQDQRVDLERIDRIASLLPRDASLAIDAVQAWTREQAHEMIDAVAELGLEWIEDPVVHNDYAGLREIVARSPVPIATGENEYLPEGFEPLLGAQPRYLLPDLQRVGGITGWRGLVDSAGKADVILTPHVYPHIALQLLSTLPYASVHEYVSWWDPLSSYELHPRDGQLEVPDVIGAGLELDPDAVERYAVTGWLPA